MISLRLWELRMRLDAIRDHEWLRVCLGQALHICLPLYDLNVNRRFAWHNIVDGLGDFEIVRLLGESRLEVHPTCEVLIKGLELGMRSVHDLRRPLLNQRDAEHIVHFLRLQLKTAFFRRVDPLHLLLFENLLDSAGSLILVVLRINVCFVF